MPKSSRRSASRSRWCATSSSGRSSTRRRRRSRASGARRPTASSPPAHRPSAWRCSRDRRAAQPRARDRVGRDGDCGMRRGSRRASDERARDRRRHARCAATPARTREIGDSPHGLTRLRTRATRRARRRRTWRRTAGAARRGRIDRERPANSKRASRDAIERATRFGDVGRALPALYLLRGARVAAFEGLASTRAGRSRSRAKRSKDATPEELVALLLARALTP